MRAGWLVGIAAFVAAASFGDLDASDAALLDSVASRNAAVAALLETDRSLSPDEESLIARALEDRSSPERLARLLRFAERRRTPLVRPAWRAAVIDGVCSSDEALAAEAIGVLGSLRVANLPPGGRARIEECLLRRISGAQPDPRDVRALGRVGGDAAIARLMELTAEPGSQGGTPPGPRDLDARQQALLTLNALNRGEPEVTRRLLDASRSRDFRSRVQGSLLYGLAEDGCATFGADDPARRRLVEHLEAGLAGPHSDAIRDGLLASRAPCSELTGAVAASLEGAAPNDLQRGLRLLGRMGGPNAAAAQLAVDTLESEVQLGALDALARHGRREDGHVAVARQAVEWTLAGDLDRTRGWISWGKLAHGANAMLAMGASPDATLRLLGRGLTSRDDDVRAAAIGATAYFAPPTAETVRELAVAACRPASSGEGATTVAFHLGAALKVLEARGLVGPFEDLPSCLVQPPLGVYVERGYRRFESHDPSLEDLEKFEAIRRARSAEGQ